MPSIDTSERTLNKCLRSAVPKPPNMEVSDMLDGMSAEFIASGLGVPLSTVYRWKQSRKVPPMAQLALATAIHGELAPMDRAWAEWKLRDGNLFSPAGEWFKPGDLLAMGLLRQLADDGQRQVRALRAELEQLRQALAAARLAIDAAEAEMARVAAQAPVRVQLVAIDQDGNQTVLTAPVAPMVLVARQAHQDGASAG